MRADTSRALLPALIATMSATAWVAIWWLGESPWAGWLHAHAPAGHHGMAGPTPAAAPGAVFIVGWIVMTVAMMLPTTIPLVRMVERLTAHRPDRGVLVLLVVAGYLSAWAACGAVVYGASLAAQSLATSAGWLASHPQLSTAGLFLIAGAFQFSPLKYRCLDKCRSPLSFVTSRWRGVRERWQSYRLGVEHGIFCVGCCWALMLLMFAFGTASVVWMLALGGLMALEKNAAWGRRLSAPLGVALVVIAVAVLVWDV